MHSTFVYQRSVDKFQDLADHSSDIVCGLAKSSSVRLVARFSSSLKILYLRWRRAGHLGFAVQQCSSKSYHQGQSKLQKKLLLGLDY